MAPFPLRPASLEVPSAVNLRVLARARTKAEQLSEAAVGPLYQRAQTFGFEREHVDAALAAVTHDADITINFDPDLRTPQTLRNGHAMRVIDGFLSNDDAHYRNQFETNFAGPMTQFDPTPNGRRAKLERGLFGRGYDGRDVTPSSRPKYGALNAEGSPAGGVAEPSYGDAYFVLADHVRPFVTLTPRDSSSTDAEHVGTVDHFAHVLLDADDDRFWRILQFQRTGRPVPSQPLGEYLEAQIHHPVSLARDVKRVSADVSLRGGRTQDKLRALAERYGLPLTWHDEARLFGDGERIPRAPERPATGRFEQPRRISPIFPAAVLSEDGRRILDWYLPEPILSEDRKLLLGYRMPGASS